MIMFVQVSNMNEHCKIDICIFYNSTKFYFILTRKKYCKEKCVNSYLSENTEESTTEKQGIC